MRALENRAIFSECRHDRDKKIEEHHERVKNVKTVVDTSVPYSLATRCTSPSKRMITKQSIRDRIVKENLKLAQKIFNIMEGNSDITEQVNDTRHIDCHPGTMNFRQRLMEAQRIHERNMLLASRLDTVQPYYKVKDLRIARPIKKKVVHKRNPKKSLFARELNTVLKGERGIQNVGQMTHRSTGHDAPVGVLKFSKLAPGDNAQSQSARKADYAQKSNVGSVDSESRTETQRTRPSNVLLEYTKIQDGRVLDVAVLKEPFRDRYAIFGIDVDDGQRYELRLTSDEVSSILDGDMLVTSVDNVEVWMALLNKVVLQRVGFFARLPFTADEVDNYNSSASSPNRAKAPQNVKAEGRASEDQEEYGESVPYHYTLTSKDAGVSPPLSPTSRGSGNAAEGPARVPTAPTGLRPSNDRPTSRVGGSAGAPVTSAAGAVRMRHLRSAGTADRDAPSSAAAGVGADTSSKARKTPQEVDEANAITDPILSLFADAGVDVDFARTEVVTPGFLANATSASVTLVETNADFPDAPVPVEGDLPVDSGAEDKVTAATKVQAAPAKGTAPKVAAPSKPTAQKAPGPNRAASMRAAEVRRKSIDAEKANSNRAVTMVAAPNKGKTIKEEVVTNKVVPVEVDKKAPPASGHAKAEPAPEVQTVPPKSAPRGAPAGPKPPTSRAPSASESSDAAVRPKSRLYTPKAPAAAPAAPTVTAAAVAAAADPTGVAVPAASEVPARPKTGGRTPTAPKTPSSAAGTSRAGSNNSPRLRPPSQSPEKIKPSSPRTQEPSAEEKVEYAPPRVAKESSAGDATTEEKLADSAPVQEAVLQTETVAAEGTLSDLTATEGVVVKSFTTEAAAEPSAEPAAKPAAEASAEPAAKPSAEPAAEAAVEVGEEKEVEGEGEDVSTALLEGSKMGRSVVSAGGNGGETPLEYSTDFENSVGGAEVYKIHE